MANLDSEVAELRKRVDILTDKVEHLESELLYKADIETVQLKYAGSWRKERFLTNALVKRFPNDQNSQYRQHYFEKGTTIRRIKAYTNEDEMVENIRFALGVLMSCEQDRIAKRKGVEVFVNIYDPIVMKPSGNVVISSSSIQGPSERKFADKDAQYCFQDVGGYIALTVLAGEFEGTVYFDVEYVKPKKENFIMDTISLNKYFH